MLYPTRIAARNTSALFFPAQPPTQPVLNRIAFQYPATRAAGNALVRCCQILLLTGFAAPLTVDFATAPTAHGQGNAKALLAAQR